jgi:predicted metal-dependent phosphoesterase TrpH
LGQSLEKNLILFDAIESSHFYSYHINLNKQAEEFARRHGLPLLGTSDAHFRFQFGRTYTLINSDKNPQSIVAAVKAGRVECVSPPLTIVGMGKILLWLSLARLIRAVRRGR